MVWLLVTCKETGGRQKTKMKIFKELKMEKSGMIKSGKILLCLDRLQNIDGRNDSRVSHVDSSLRHSSLPNALPCLDSTVYDLILSERTLSYLTCIIY